MSFGFNNIPIVIKSRTRSLYFLERDHIKWNCYFPFTHRMHTRQTIKQSSSNDVLAGYVRRKLKPDLVAYNMVTSLSLVATSIIMQLLWREWARGLCCTSLFTSFSRSLLDWVLSFRFDWQTPVQYTLYRFLIDITAV